GGVEGGAVGGVLVEQEHVGGLAGVGTKKQDKKLKSSWIAALKNGNSPRRTVPTRPVPPGSPAFSGKLGVQGPELTHLLTENSCCRGPSSLSSAWPRTAEA